MGRKRIDPSESIVSKAGSRATPLRLRIPASLAIALLGASATATMSIGACDPTPEPPPQPDAGELSKMSDAGPDTVLADDDDPPSDGGLADGSVDGPISAADARPDAPTPIDAYVPPDTPVG